MSAHATEGRPAQFRGAARPLETIRGKRSHPRRSRASSGSGKSRPGNLSLRTWSGAVRGQELRNLPLCVDDQGCVGWED